jgi:hypothetical protein
MTYQQEKGGLLYHKLQEVPLELSEKSRKASTLPPGEKLFKDITSDEDDEAWMDTSAK